MLNFRNINIVFASLLLLLIVFDIRVGVMFFAYLLLVVSYMLLLFYGSYFVQSQFYMQTVCQADTHEKKIALTFDDGPLEKYTPQILQILKEHQIKATFFCIGKNVAMHKILLKQMHAEGHIIGSHSYSHGFWFDLLSAKKMKEDLQQIHQLIKDETGADVKWFRPPYGVTTPNLAKAVKQMNYTAIGWNVRSMDTVIKNEEKLYNRLKRALRPGSIFLLHDSAAVTVKILPEFIACARQLGYEIVPLDKLINLQPYANE